jgi:hypothetical protein
MVIASYRSASLGGRVSGALNASAWCLGFELSGKAHVRPARSIFSNALNLSAGKDLFNAEPLDSK